MAWLAFKDFPTLIMTRCFESNVIGLDQHPTRMASSTSNWKCLAENERMMWKEPLCIIGEADLLKYKYLPNDLFICSLLCIFSSFLTYF